MTARCPRIPDAAEVLALAEAVGGLFAGPPPAPPLRACGHCLPIQMQRELLSVPPMELPEGLLGSYLLAAVGEDRAAVAEELRFFLPRLLVGTVRGERPGLTDPMVAHKLAFGRSRSDTPERLRAVRRVLRAWLAHLCGHPPPDRLLHPAEAIAGIVRSGLDRPSPLLALWEARAHELHALCGFLEAMPDLSRSDLRIDWRGVLCFEGDEEERRVWDWDPRPLLDALQGWSGRPDTLLRFRESLGRRLRAGRAGEILEHLDTADEAGLHEYHELLGAAAARAEAAG